MDFAFAPLPIFARLCARFACTTQIRLQIRRTKHLPTFRSAHNDVHFHVGGIAPHSPPRFLYLIVMLCRAPKYCRSTESLERRAARSESALVSEGIYFIQTQHGLPGHNDVFVPFRQVQPHRHHHEMVIIMGILPRVRLIRDASAIILRKRNYTHAIKLVHVRTDDAHAHNAQAQINPQNVRLPWPTVAVCVCVSVRL